MAAGAVALVVERPLELDVPQLLVDDARASMAIAADVFFGEPTRSLEVAGVTGTNGKTTTTFLLRSVLDAAGRSPGLVGTVEWVVGGEVRPAPHTTPEAIDLQRLFREMLDAGDRSVAVEASSHGSALHRLDRVRFDALVFTNLSQDHLDLHGTMEEYYQAKRRLFTGAQPPPAAVNVGDEHGRRLALELVESRRAPLVTFGLTDAAEIRPEGLEMGPHGQPLPRRRDRDRDAAAWAVQRRERPRRDRRRHPPRHRRRRDRRGRSGDDRRARAGSRRSTRASRSRSSSTTRTRRTRSTSCSRRPASSASGRLICVFGAGGDRDRGKRPVMGAVAVQRADHVIVTSDNPRSEDPLAIIQDILQGAGVGVEIDPDRRCAIHRAVVARRRRATSS